MPGSASTQSPGYVRSHHAGTTEARKKASGRGRGGEEREGGKEGELILSPPLGPLS